MESNALCRTHTDDTENPFLTDGGLDFVRRLISHQRQTMMATKATFRVVLGCVDWFGPSATTTTTTTMVA